MHHVFSGLGGLVGKNQTYINVCVIPTLRIGQLLTLSWLLVMVGSSPQLCPTMRVPVRPLGVVYRWKREGMKGPQEPIPFTCLGNPMKHIWVTQPPSPWLIHSSSKWLKMLARCLITCAFFGMTIPWWHSSKIHLFFDMNRRCGWLDSMCFISCASSNYFHSCWWWWYFWLIERDDLNGTVAYKPSRGAQATSWWGTFCMVQNPGVFCHGPQNVKASICSLQLIHRQECQKSRNGVSPLTKLDVNWQFLNFILDLKFWAII